MKYLRIQFFNPRWLLVAVIVFSALTRFWRLDLPREYVFDEVYHAFTAKMYALDRYEAWVWWTSPPDGVAYEWTHPPLAKVIMGWGIDMFGGPGELPTKVVEPTLESGFTQVERDEEKKTNKILANESLSWRITGAIFGVLCTFGLYLLASHWFKNQWVGVIAAFLFSVDLLPLVQSRTAMNDIYAVTFLVYGFYFFTRRVIPAQAGIHGRADIKAKDSILSSDKSASSHSVNIDHAMDSGLRRNDNFLLSSHLPLLYWLLSGLMIGCAIASKWTSLFALGIVGVYHVITIIVTLYRSEISDLRSQIYLKYAQSFVIEGFKGLSFFLVLPFAIYLLSYWQLFTLPIADYQGNDLGGDIVSGEVPENERWFFYPLHGQNAYFADRMYIWWGLQKQMWWYHTNLNAEHNYTSKWWSWPFMVRPVWFYVSYCNAGSEDMVCQEQLEKYEHSLWYRFTSWQMSLGDLPGDDISPPMPEKSLIGDVYTMGNPLMYWAFAPLLVVFVRGFLFEYRWWFASVIVFAVFLLLRFNFAFAGFAEPQSLMAQAGTVFEQTFPSVLLFTMLMLLFVAVIQVGTWVVDRDTKRINEALPLLLALLCFAAFWLPWARSPRIMFYYHFFPPVTFMYVFMAGMLHWIAKRSEAMRTYVQTYLLIVFVAFLYFYPHVTAFLLPEALREQYWWFESWK